MPRRVTKLHTFLDMALPLLPGLTPLEVAFLCEMELVTVIPRQRLEAIQLLGVSSTRWSLSTRWSMFRTTPFTYVNISLLE
jgi:hypothetical protein